MSELIKNSIKTHGWIDSVFAKMAYVVCSCVVLVSCGAPTHTPSPNGAKASLTSPPVAVFDWFEYTGSDPVFNTNLKADEFLNPVLAGFYPDPSVVRVENDYYLTNSTFGFYPGLPIFHSQDLVNWTQIGNAIDRPGMVDFSGIHLGWNGLYAPTIDFHEGVFYLINTCIACGGDFILTAKDPAGPWSDPVWIGDLSDTRGIDPQMFWEDNRLYILNHENPAGEMLYEGHRAIWIREVDPQTYAIIGEKKMIIDGGVNHLIDKPVYVEGPHLYKVGDYYYLSAPEGGTGLLHRQTAWRSADIWGPYEPYEDNPILTQIGLPENRPNPITSTGHADMVETQNGEWWAVFLGTRTYQDFHFSTGRETFLLPVTWTEDGWPDILPKGTAVPYVLKRPDLPQTALPKRPITGNFTIRSNFDEELTNDWSFVRIPDETWWQADNGALAITAREDRIGDSGQPAIIARRLQHMNAEATTKLVFDANHLGDEAGLIVLQNDDFYYAFGIGADASSSPVIRLRQRGGSGDYVGGETLKEAGISLNPGDPVYLRASIAGPELDFSYSLDGESYLPFVTGADGKMLGSPVAGGFTGAFLGMYAETGEVREIKTISASDLAEGVIAPSTPFTSATGVGGKYSLVGSPGLQVAEEALRVEVERKQVSPWDASVSGGVLPGGFVEGDELEIKLWVRAEKGPGKITIGLHSNEATKSNVLSETLTVSETWAQYSITGPAELTLPPGTSSLTVQVGHAAHILHFGPFEVTKRKPYNQNK